MLKIVLQCMICDEYSDEHCEFNPTAVLELSEQWRRISVSFDQEGKFVYDPNSPMEILICPKCSVKGEPRLN